MDWNLAEFIHMGGYGLYVWSSYGLTLVVILANIIQPIMKRKKLSQQVSPPEGKHTGQESQSENQERREPT